MSKHTEHLVDDTTTAQEQADTVRRTWSATVAKCQPTPEPQHDATGRKDAAYANRTQAMYSAQYHTRHAVYSIGEANQYVCGCEENGIDQTNFDLMMRALRNAQAEVTTALGAVEAWRLKQIEMDGPA
jgi:hypothetical protein